MYGKKGFAKGLIKMKEENKKYTAAEIARYHVGERRKKFFHFFLLETMGGGVWLRYL